MVPCKARIKARVHFVINTFTLLEMKMKTLGIGIDIENGD
jgi:hypothetical protein